MEAPPRGGAFVANGLLLNVSIFSECILNPFLPVKHLRFHLFGSSFRHVVLARGRSRCNQVRHIDATSTFALGGYSYGHTYGARVTEVNVISLSRSVIDLNRPPLQSLAVLINGKPHGVGLPRHYAAEGRLWIPTRHPDALTLR